MKYELDADNTLVTVIILILLVVSLPSAIAARVAMDRFGPFHVAIATSLYMVSWHGPLFTAPPRLAHHSFPCFHQHKGLVTAVAPFLLHGATDKAQKLARELMPIFAVMWGVGFGVYYPCIQATYTMIIPAGSEAELMGLYYFCTKVLSWAPPLLFVVFNNWTGEQKAGLWVLAAFFLLGIIPYCMLDLEKARDMVAHTLQSRAMSPRR
jgi:MFS-type transporter involved in bile tolerance (Atg22 family)